MSTIIKNKRFKIDEITNSTASLTRIEYSDYYGEKQSILIDSTDIDYLIKLINEYNN